MSRLARDSNSSPIQCLRPGAAQTVSVSAVAASSTAITQRITRIVCTVGVHINVTGTATTSDYFLPANTVEYIHTYEGDTISFIAAEAGTAYVSEMI
jgi:penicillin-binding protein-related factor A (putative recombinase)